MTGSVGKVIMVYGVRGIVDSSDTILMVKMDEYEGISFEVGVSEARLYNVCTCGCVMLIWMGVM